MMVTTAYPRYTLWSEPGRHTLVIQTADGRPLRTERLPLPEPWVPPAVPEPPRMGTLQPIWGRAREPGPEPPGVRECRAFRDRMGWSQYELAQRTGYPRSTVAHMELGIRPAEDLRRAIGKLVDAAAAGEQKGTDDAQAG